MESNFSVEEKRKFMLKKHIKDHLFEYILDIIVIILFTILILYLCKAQNFIFGIVLAFAYSLGKVLYNIHYYKKEYIDVDIK